MTSDERGQQSNKQLIPPLVSEDTGDVKEEEAAMEVVA